MLSRGKSISLMVIVFLISILFYLLFSSRSSPSISILSAYPGLSIAHMDTNQLTARTNTCVIHNSSLHLRDDRRPIGIQHVRYILTDKPQSWDIWAQNIPQTSTDIIEEIKSLGERISGNTLTLYFFLDPNYLSLLTDQQASIEFSESINRALLKYCRGENQTSAMTSREAFAYYAQQRQSYTPLITVHRQ